MMSKKRVIQKAINLLPPGVRVRKVVYEYYESFRFANLWVSYKDDDYRYSRQDSPQRVSIKIVDGEDCTLYDNNNGVETMMGKVIKDLVDTMDIFTADQFIASWYNRNEKQGG